MADRTVVDLLREKGMTFHPTTSPDHLARFVVRNPAGRRVFAGSEPEIHSWLTCPRAELTFEVRSRLSRQMVTDILKDDPDSSPETCLEAVCDMGWASSAAEATELLDGERYEPAEKQRAIKRSGRAREGEREKQARRRREGGVA